MNFGQIKMDIRIGMPHYCNNFVLDAAAYETKLALSFHLCVLCATLAKKRQHSDLVKIRLSIVLPEDRFGIDFILEVCEVNK